VLDLRIVGQRLEHTYFDFALVLLTDQEAEIRIQTKYSLKPAGGIEGIFDPNLSESPMPSALIGLRQLIMSADADEGDGSLTIVLADGLRLWVPPNDNYEAWTLSDTIGTRVVTLPGGGLAVWPAHD
jgi:hypothetical protein